MTQFVCLLAATGLYCGTAIGFAMSHRWGMALCYVGYVIANLGLLLVAATDIKKPGQ
jgi:hypothetical protein